MNLPQACCMLLLGLPQMNCLAGWAWYLIIKGATGYAAQTNVIANDQSCLPHNLKK